MGREEGGGWGRIVICEGFPDFYLFQYFQLQFIYSTPSNL